MRFFNALFGSLITPLAYWTGLELHFSHPGAILFGIMTITGKSTFAILITSNNNSYRMSMQLLMTRYFVLCD